MYLDQLHLSQKVKVKDGVLSTTAVSQGQRSALAIVGGYLYVTYGGHAGDCSTYYGWIVGVPLNNPTNVLAWATSARISPAFNLRSAASRNFRERLP